MKLQRERLLNLNMRKLQLKKFYYNYNGKFIIMKIPSSVLKRVALIFGFKKAQRIGDEWFYLTLDNFRYVDDGDEIGFVNCKSGEVYMGHLFKEFSKDWRKVRIYYRTVRRIKSRVVEVDVRQNLFFFRKIKKNEAFGVYYMLRGLEEGRLVVR
jgi:hypothetical protein